MMIYPPQCPEIRHRTFSEWARSIIPYSLGGFVYPYEAQCRRYADHADFPDQIPHRDIHGKEWAEE